MPGGSSSGSPASAPRPCRARFHALLVDLPQDARGRDLAAEELTRYGARLEPYLVAPLGPVLAAWPAPPPAAAQHEPERRWPSLRASVRFLAGFMLLSLLVLSQAWLASRGESLVRSLLDWPAGNLRPSLAPHPEFVRDLLLFLLALICGAAVAATIYRLRHRWIHRAVTRSATIES